MGTHKNNQELIDLMEERGMNTSPMDVRNYDVPLIAELINVSRYTVLAYLRPAGWKASRNMPESRLRELKERLKEKGL